MKLAFDIREEFGTSFPCDGEEAVRFRQEKVEPWLSLAEEVEFNFAGVRNANSSFCNALVANLVARHSEDVIQKLRLTNCCESVRTLLSGALRLGVTRYRERASV